MQPRLNDSVMVRCPTDLREALERIAGGPRALSETVRRALVEFVERSANAEREANR